MELQDVVGERDQRPLTTDLLQSAQQESSEASRLFDLAEYGLDDRLSPRVDGLACLGGELTGHRLLDAHLARRAAANGWWRFIVALSAGRDVGVDAPLLGLAHVVVREVPGVPDQLLWR